MIDTLSTEMRSHVLTPMHHLRRHIDAFLTFLIRPSPQKDVSLGNPFPTPHVAGWTSLYSMVTFRPDVGYAEALRKERSQKKVVAGLGWIGATGLGVAAVAVGFRAWRTWAQRA
jgi:kynurenine 3-monooxygenase